MYTCINKYIMYIYMYIYIMYKYIIHYIIYNIYIIWNDRWPLCLWAKTHVGSYIKRLRNYMFLSWKLYYEFWKLYLEICPVALSLM